MGRTLLLSTVALQLMLSACVIQAPAEPGDDRYAPVVTPQVIPGPNTRGSLYNRDTNISFFTDRKAFRVGDILLVILQENTSTTKSQTSDIKKENEVSLPSTNVFGDILEINGNPLSASALAQDREFKGDSSADQSNNLLGSITVTVNKVYPNGNLYVSGEKWMTLSTGDEFIRLSGIVRPDDISPTNELASTRLADARITYSSEGALAEANRMGWMTRFFNSEYWPF